MYGIYYQTSHFDEAADILSKIENKYGITYKTALERADLKYHSKDLPGALASLKAVPNQDTITKNDCA